MNHITPKYKHHIDLVEFCERNGLGVRACMAITRIMAGEELPTNWEFWKCIQWKIVFRQA